ncbi:MAG: D-alanine--D-alanine ligase family protein, partial [Desulfomonilia bacterium]|nr:D-alanine--D-alanine ligase family protein [Desulfomonilia bacterium]
MKSQLKVAVIFGGVSTEHEVSIVSATSVVRNIDRSRFEPILVAIDKKGRWFLGPGAFRLLAGDEAGDVQRVVLSTDPERRGFLHLDSGKVTEVDVVFPVLHGPRGEDGTIQGLLELVQIPYVGCDPLASAIAMDKDVTKRILSQRNLPVVKGTCVSKWLWFIDRDEVLDEISDTLSFPLFIKPATMGSSIGISKAHGSEDLVHSIEIALSFSSKVVIEQAVEDPLELEVAVLGNYEPQASLPGQVIPCNEFYDFDAKYVDSSSELIIPAQINRRLSDDIQFMAV